MRHKQYVQECKECGRKYIATRKGSQYCSGACRALASRKRKKNTELSKEVKRPRGRPRKNPEKPAPEQRIYVPRPVGRPRKNPSPVEVQDPDPVQRSKNEDTPEVKAAKAKLDQERKEREARGKDIPLPGMFADQEANEAELRAKQVEQKKKEKEKADRWLDETLGG
jgi:uncharacterized protein (DUF58 family)